jgi:SAM-dependent methyltransferase
VPGGGAGSGSIARWLLERVGPTGHVVATDLDVSLITPLLAASTRLSVRREDIAEQVPASPKAGGFDRIHARLVLGHIARPEIALRNILAGLRPGGVALIEDADFLWSDVGELPSYPESAAHTCFGVWRATVKYMQSRGYAVHWGRRLAATMRAVGFEQVCGEAVMLVGNASLQAGMRMTIQRFAPALVERRRLTQAELDACLTTLADPQLTFTGSPTFSIWGSRAG